MRNNNQSLPVRVTFSLFGLETGYDWLYVYDIRNSSLLLGSFTGFSLPPPIMNSRAVRIVFTSDGTDFVPYNFAPTYGFEATYGGWSCARDSDCTWPRGACVTQSGVCQCVDGYAGAACEQNTCLGTRFIDATSSGVLSSGVAAYRSNSDCRWAFTG